MTGEAATPERFRNGSTWVRADFHMHTHADKEFDYSEQSSGFVSAYVAALKAACIQVGVITNHNKFDRNEFKALSKASKKEEILTLKHSVSGFGNQSSK